jgi:hypothetical protein
MTGAAFGALAALIWAGFPAITKLTMAGNALDAFDVTALRFGVGGLVLLPLFLRRGLNGVGLWPAVLLACGAGAPYVLLTAGLAYAPAGHMGVITPSGLAGARDPVAARDSDAAAARRRGARERRHGARAGPSRPREVALAAQDGSDSMNCTMRLRSA